MAYEQHAQDAKSIVAARCAIITLSDTRNEQTDTSGKRIGELLEAEHHAIASYRIIPDDPPTLSRLLDELLADANIEVILTNGGTGISQRDGTIEVVASKLTTPLPGFGELFRMLSYEQVGAAAMLSRAVAGIYRGVVVFSVPGSPGAVRLAWERLILPELEHVAWEVGR